MKRLSIAFTLALSAASPSFAQDVQTQAGPYLQLSVGAGLGGETEVYGNIVGVGSASDEGDIEAGLFAAIAAGQSMTNGFAVEAELLHMKNDIDTDALNTLVGVPLDASVQTTALMVNALYAVTSAGPLTLSVGGGIGYGHVNYELLGENGKDYNYMWQLMAGLSYPVTETFSWEAKYRYLRGPEYSETVDLGSDTVTVEAQTSTHALTFGGRFKF